MNNPSMSAHERGHIEALVRANHGNPFAYLGLHTDDLESHAGGAGYILRAYFPGALAVGAVDGESGASRGHMAQHLAPGLFTLPLERRVSYYYRIRWDSGVHETEDPYAFGPLLGETDLYLFAEGNHRELGQVFGAQLARHEGVEGVRFSVWAPNAQRVSVVGNFNAWDSR